MTSGNDTAHTPTGRWRNFTGLALGILISGGLLGFVNAFTPVQDWLIVQLGPLLAWQLVMNAAFLCGGFAIVERLMPIQLPFLEKLSISVTVGVAAFYLALYGLGTVHLFHPWPAVMLPLVFVAAGVGSVFRCWQDRHRGQALGRSSMLAAAPLRGIPLAVTIFGCFGVAVVYLGILSPSAINYDASWYHLPVAESYAREGHILPLDGNWHREYPQLANILHTWGFLVPGINKPALRWMMALHTEFALFVWTLVGIAAGVNWILRTEKVRGAWAAFFLFPGIFVYDGNLGGAADHVLGLFSVPLLLLSVRAPEVRKNGGFLVWGAIAGAALMTKYQAVYFIGPLGLLLLARTIHRRRHARLLDVTQMVVSLVAGLTIVVAPHFIKNIVFHANPVYPFLQDWFKRSHPTIKDAAMFVENIAADRASRAPPEIGRRIRESLELIFTFSFKPHYSFMGNLPTLGFGFTLSLPFLLVAQDRRRLLVGAFVSIATLFVWASTYRVDRHIQTFLPLLVVSTAGTLIATWRLGLGARIGVIALLGTQLVWAGDIYSLGLERIAAAVPIINSGREGRARTRFDGFFADQVAISRALPKNAVVLLHHWHSQLGIDRPVYLDWVGFQGVIDYRQFNSPRDLQARLRTLGITHIVHFPGTFTSPYLSEMVLFEGLTFESPGPKLRFGQFEVFPLPKETLVERPELRVLVLGMGRYTNGVYPVRKLDNCDTLPASLQNFNPPELAVGPSGVAPLLDGVDAVVRDSKFGADAATSFGLARDFQPAATFPSLTIYLRTASTTGRVPFKQRRSP